jgi:hypothetical protein
LIDLLNTEGTRPAQRDPGRVGRPDPPGDPPRLAEAAPFKEVTEWMEPYRQFWDANFARLDAHLKRIQQPESGQPDQAETT